MAVWNTVQYVGFPGVRMPLNMLKLSLYTAVDGNDAAPGLLTQLSSLSLYGNAVSAH